MVSFARARTKSWLSRLFSVTAKPIKSKTEALKKTKEVFEKHHEQNKFFLEASKNGGMWFS